jgi:epoxyqueuosine reductase
MRAELQWRLVAFVAGYRCGTAPVSHRTFPVDRPGILGFPRFLIKRGIGCGVMKYGADTPSRMPSPSHPTAALLVAEATARGFNLGGFVGSALFDACQPAGRRAVDLLPGCGTIFLMGSGGAGFWNHLLESAAPIQVPASGYHPVDDYCAANSRELTEHLAARGVRARAAFPDDPSALNFMQLAEMAGWGTISPVLGILLHPEFGPWVSMRAAILIEGLPFGAVEGGEHPAFQPCLKCDKPCVTACPVGVFDGLGAVDLRACAEHRHADRCGHGCDARRACPVGADERYGEVEERFRHAYSLFTMRRHFEL